MLLLLLLFLALLLIMGLLVDIAVVDSVDSHVDHSFIICFSIDSVWDVCDVESQLSQHQCQLISIKSLLRKLNKSLLSRILLYVINLEDLITCFDIESKMNKLSLKLKVVVALRQNHSIYFEKSFDFKLKSVSVNEA